MTTGHALSVVDFFLDRISVASPQWKNDLKREHTHAKPLRDWRVQNVHFVKPFTYFKNAVQSKDEGVN
jgi:hypothetical protein